MANEEDSKFNGSECAPRKGFSVLKVICVLVIPHSYTYITLIYVYAASREKTNKHQLAEHSSISGSRGGSGGSTTEFFNFSFVLAAWSSENTILSAKRKR